MVRDGVGDAHPTVYLVTEESISVRSRGFSTGSRSAAAAVSRSPVGSDKNGRRQALRLHCLAGYRSRSQLNCVISSQAVMPSELNRTVDNRSIDWKQEIVFFTILQETAQDTIPLLFGDTAGCPMFGRHCSSHLCERNLGEQDGVLRIWIADLPHPRTPRFVSVAFYQGTGIEVVIGHALGPRCSRMTSPRVGPAACARI